MIKLERILVATDFSDNSRRALEYAAAFGERFDSLLYIIHVLENVFPLVAPEPGFVLESAGEYAKEYRKNANTAMEKLVEAPPLLGKKVIHRVLEGEPFLNIIRYARDNSIDLIVMGTHGRTRLPHLLIGSVAEKVVRKAPCPVLTIRPAGHQFVMP